MSYDLILNSISLPGPKAHEDQIVLNRLCNLIDRQRWVTVKEILGTWQPKHKSSLYKLFFFSASSPLRSQALKMLIAAGVEADGRDNFGNTAMHYAAKFNSPQAIAVLSSRALNRKNWLGNTPLIVAAAAGCGAATQQLIDQGAALHLRNDKGFSALEMAEYGKFPRPAALLRKALIQENENLLLSAMDHNLPSLL